MNMDMEEELEERAIVTASRRRFCAMKEDKAGEAMSTTEYKQIKAKLEEANKPTIVTKKTVQEASKLHEQLEGEM